MDRSRNWRRSKISGGTQGVPAWRRNGSLMKRVSSRRPWTGLTSIATGETLQGATGLGRRCHLCFPAMPTPRLTGRADARPRITGGRLREGPRPRPRRAARGRQGGRPPPLLPDPRVAGRPRGRDGGPRDDHARLQQLPGADHRRAGEAGRPRRARGLRDRGHRLAPAERHHPAAPRARARARRVDGDRGRDRLHHRLPVEPGRDQRHPRARRHRDLRLGRPRLDPRRLQALRRPAAALPPQPDGQARDDARARRSRRERHPGGRRRRLLDGGRRLRPAADRRAHAGATAPG